MAGFNLDPQTLAMLQGVQGIDPSQVDPGGTQVTPFFSEAGAPDLSTDPAVAALVARQTAPLQGGLAKGPASQSGMQIAGLVGNQGGGSGFPSMGNVGDALTAAGHQAAVDRMVKGGFTQSQEDEDRKNQSSALHGLVAARYLAANGSPQQQAAAASLNTNLPALLAQQPAALQNPLNSYATPGAKEQIAKYGGGILQGLGGVLGSGKQGGGMDWGGLVSGAKKAGGFIKNIFGGGGDSATPMDFGDDF